MRQYFIAYSRIATIKTLLAELEQKKIKLEAELDSLSGFGVPFDDMSIGELDLPVRIYNALTRPFLNGDRLETVAEILMFLDRGPDAILAMRNFGEQSLKILLEELSRKGFVVLE